MLRQFEVQHKLAFIRHVVCDESALQVLTDTYKKLFSVSMYHNVICLNKNDMNNDDYDDDGDNDETKRTMMITTTTTVMTLATTTTTIIITTTIIYM